MFSSYFWGIYLKHVEATDVKAFRGLAVGRPVIQKPCGMLAWMWMNVLS